MKYLISFYIFTLFFFNLNHRENTSYKHLIYDLDGIQVDAKYQDSKFHFEFGQHCEGDTSRILFGLRNSEVLHTKVYDIKTSDSSFWLESIGKNQILTTDTLVISKDTLWLSLVYAPGSNPSAKADYFRLKTDFEPSQDLTFNIGKYFFVCTETMLRTADSIVVNRKANCLDQLLLTIPSGGSADAVAVTKTAHYLDSLNLAYMDSTFEAQLNMTRNVFYERKDKNVPAALVFKAQKGLLNISHLENGVYFLSGDNCNWNYHTKLIIKD